MTVKVKVLEELPVPSGQGMRYAQPGEELTMKKGLAEAREERGKVQILSSPKRPAPRKSTDPSGDEPDKE